MTRIFDPKPEAAARAAAHAPDASFHSDLESFLPDLYGVVICTPDSTHADYMAAVLACGDGAVLSHRAAAHLQRLLRGSPPRPEVTVPSMAGRSRKGIVIHRVRSLPYNDTKTVYGIA